MSLNTQLADKAAERMTFREFLKTLVTLFKLRIVILLLFAALGGAFLGAQGVPSLKEVIAVLITGTLAAGGASAINQYLEIKSDAQMRRTMKRPLAAGIIDRPVLVLWVAGAMVVAAVLMVLFTRPVMALYLLLGALIYVGVYTIWLKPRSVLNIVIGGAAGSMAVMTGGAAVGAASDPGVIVLALLLFLWTPAHFWALAMFYEEDYARADVPMLPVKVTAGNTAWWIFAHAASTGLAALLLAVHPALGWAYFVPTVIITVLMMASSLRLIRTPERKQAIKLFVLTNIFLAMVLAAVMLAATGNQLLFT
jgi:protoheme IX farnesyltransferase